MWQRRCRYCSTKSPVVSSSWVPERNNMSATMGAVLVLVLVLVLGSRSVRQSKMHPRTTPTIAAAATENTRPMLRTSGEAVQIVVFWLQYVWRHFTF